MKSNTIIINGDKYLVEMIDSDIISTKQYVAFRNNDVINDMTVDTDIYLAPIDRDIPIIWPSTNTTGIPLMSTNSDAFSESIKNEYDNPTPARIIPKYYSTWRWRRYSFSILLDEDLYIKNVKTIKLRIWHPTTDLNRDMILYVDSWVNSLHIHWYCDIIQREDKHTGKERRLNQDIYNEYFEVEIPDFRDVLYGSTYIEEPSLIFRNEYSKNKIKYAEELIPVRAIHKDTDYKVYEELEEPEDGCIQLADMNLLLHYWKYHKEDDGTEMKEYVENPYSIPEMISLNVTLYPWKSISDNGIFTINKYAKPASCYFVDDFKMSIKASFEFINGTISVVGRFCYPESFSSIESAWQRIYSTDFSKYKSLSEKAKDYEDLKEILGDSLEMVKYTCIVSSDYLSKNIIHEEISYSDRVDDFSFPMKDLFSKWSQVPDNVYVRLIMEDRAIGKNCSSPTVLFTKDKLKYTINEQQYTRLSIKKKETDIDDMNKENFNFISNMNCRIVKSNDDKQQIQKNSVQPRIIYKPIFFKVQDLQNIVLRSNMSQNIGISLSSYVNKVDEFILSIGENKWHESSRTSSFVIFNVNSKLIKEATGKYDILTSDNEYLSTGNYTIE
jgi:hypothetical protein